jgi:hypothetical protein
MLLALRQLESGLFYSEGGWTRFQNRARHFTNKEQVEDFLKASCLTGMEIAILIDGEIVGGMPTGADAI